MSGYEHLLWAPAVVSVAYMGHRVAVRWLDASDRRAARLEQRDEREAGAFPRLQARVEECEKRVDDMHREQKTFLANARSR